MAGSILSQLFSKRSFRVESSTFGPVLTGVKIVNVKIRLRSKLMVNTSENGQPIIDARIIEPDEIEVSAICATIDDVESINQLLADKSATYNIYSRGLYRENFTLVTDKMMQRGAMISATPVRLQFRRILMQRNSDPICLQAADSTTVFSGFQNTIQVAKTNISAAMDKIKSTAAGLF